MKTYEILLLHEDPWLLNAIAFGLESIGCRLHAVCDPRGAIEMMDIEAEGNKYHFTKMCDDPAEVYPFRMKHFDLVIADANAHPKSNVAALKKAKGSKVETAATIRLAGRALGLGPRVRNRLADDYLLMPFSPKELWNKILDRLDQSGRS